MITGARLRAGKTNSGKGAARMIAQAVDHCPRRRGTGQILVRGDSRVRQPRRGGRVPRAGCPVLAGADQEPARSTAAIDSIGEDAWIPVNYPGAVRDPDTGEWISDAEVAEIGYTAFASTPMR